MPRLLMPPGCRMIDVAILLRNGRSVRGEIQAGGFDRRWHGKREIVPERPATIPNNIDLRQRQETGIGMIVKEALKYSSPRRKPGSSSLNFLDSGVRRNDESAIDQRLLNVRPRVVLITGRLGNGMVLIARSDTYTGDALRLAGADHALEQTVVPQVSPEAVIAADPDVLLFAGTREHFEELLASPGWSLLRAVRAQRAYLVARSEFLIPGPRTFDGIEKLSSMLAAAEGG